MDKIISIVGINGLSIFNEDIDERYYTKIELYDLILDTYDNK